MTDVVLDRTVAVHVSVDSSPLPQAWLDDLVELRVHAALSTTAECSLRFHDDKGDRASDALFALGKEIKVAFGNVAAAFVGEVTSFEVEHDVDVTEFVVVARDRSHRLTRPTVVATHLKSTYGDVLSALANAAGLSAQASGFSTVHEYVLRHDSPMGALEEITERTGTDWWVEGTTLHVAKPTARSGPTLSVGVDLVRFKVRTTATSTDEVSVRGWDPKQKAPIVKPSTSNAPGVVTASSELVEKTLRKGQQGFGAQAKRTAAGLSPLAVQEAGDLGWAIVQDGVASAVQARGTTVANVDIRPGTVVTVDRAGAASGTYPVASVEHVYSRSSGYTLRFTSGSRRRTMLADALVAAPPAGSTMHHERLVVGVVTNNADDQHPGQVRVKFPSLTETDESTWCRILVPDAGDQRGSLFVPEINDEVLVGFEDGDVRRPVVLGSMYGGKTTVPPWTVESGKVVARRTRSRVGHIFEIGDGEARDKRHFLFQLADGTHKLRLGADRTDLELPAGDELKIKVGNTTITIAERTGDVEISGPNITLKSTGKLVLEGTQVQIKSTGQMNVQSTGTLDVKSDAIGTVQASGMLQLKGAMVKIN